MCDLNLLDSTKTVLKYLIYIDFFNYTQRHVPLFELGFSSWVTFLQSIPDVLQVDPVTLQVRPAPMFHRPVSIRSHFLRPPPTTLPCVPWTQSYRQGIDESTSIISLLGPRTYGDGKCSSSDSIDVESDERYKQDGSKTTEFVETLTLSKNDPKGDFDFHVDRSVTTAFAETLMISKYNSKNDFDFDYTPKNDKKIGTKVVRFDLTPSNGELQFEEDTELDLGNVMLQRSLCNRSSDMIVLNFDDNAPPCYSAAFDYDNDYNLSSPEEEKLPIFSDDERDDAVPSMFDEKINLLSSCFFSGKFVSSFRTTNIDDIMQIGNVYELYVSEVNSPFKFWFQLDEETPNAVEEMQEHLNQCYNMTDCIPGLIKQEHMHKGYACAALYGTNWHRGEIIEKLKDGRVGIFFVDFGTVDQVKSGDVRYLLESFGSAPKLCHRGSLDFIKPSKPSHRWTVDATSYLINLVTDKKLTAGITEVDRKNNAVRMYLIDTGANININTSLVIEGFAYPENPRDRYQDHVASIVPSFESLETGEHASFSQVLELLEQDYDYEEQLLHKSVIEEFDCYISPHATEEEAKARMEQYMTKKEEGRKLAKRRDTKLFSEIFKFILTNPFLNGTMTDKLAIEATNPFSD